MKYWTTNFSIHASECPVFIMIQLKSVYNIPFLGSHSHPTHTCLSMIASNGMKLCFTNEFVTLRLVWMVVSVNDDQIFIV